MTHTVYISKYWETAGILKAPAEIHNDKAFMDVHGNIFRVMLMDGEWALSLFRARAQARLMKRRQIRRLRQRADMLSSYRIPKTEPCLLAELPADLITKDEE